MDFAVNSNTSPGALLIDSLCIGINVGESVLSAFTVFDIRALPEEGLNSI